MDQHTVVSAAPACGVHVPIRSHIQALCATKLCLTREARAGVCHVMRCAGGEKPSPLCSGPKVTKEGHRNLAIESPSLGRDE
ncbi:BZ3500_MvSof-1268-A1-R1_Chr4-3g07226 [Microbotryum saponariae]|uniref:BZ3500_MvSof-1268-A1-R1_Chr4-3g07226 protein n=1 Tax=Microbotryum saponariae TaxID=289078 RepID=A0A2X0LLQ5_9BASI|nr:BZ3500_MvSof-1268-A1-R1_Chr4-3g07226 [Microbotryum saponariae]SDA06889.1 BZ3501_MvSof-1269-A2-R1_Chr4-2g06935 [Microbotryum saponariae]